MLGRYEHDPSTTFDELRERQPVPVEILEAGRRELLEHGYVTEEEDGTTAITPAGVAVLDQLRAQTRARLERLLDGWEPEQYPELERLLTRLAGDYAEAPPKAGSAA
jgi:DNA-binding MarR family transcriptional regulator